jgi:hypothetical protein
MTEEARAIAAMMVVMVVVAAAAAGVVASITFLKVLGVMNIVTFPGFHNK